MDMDKAAFGLDTTDNPGADSQRLASASSFHIVALKAATCSPMDFGQSNHIPNPAETGIDTTRLHRLHEAVKVEAVPSAQKGRESGELLFCNR